MTALSAVDTSSYSAPPRLRVLGVRSSKAESHLRLADGSRLVVDAPADVEAARRWLAAVRRVGLVDIERRGTTHVAVATGIGPRLPFERRLTLAIALGLCRLGVPTTISDRRLP